MLVSIWWSVFSCKIGLSHHNILKASASLPKDFIVVDNNNEGGAMTYYSSLSEEKIKTDKRDSRITRRDFVGQKLMLCHYLLKPGVSIQRHKHEHEQFSYIIKGAMEFIVGGQKRVLKAESVLHVPSNTDHEAATLEETEMIDIFTPIREDLLKD